MATLGISTNTRLVGIAIINRDNLIDYSIHLNKESWSQSKAIKIIASLEACVRRYCIKNVVLSIPHVYHQTEAWKYLSACIYRHFKKRGITVQKETIEAIYSFWLPGQKKTKKAMMASLVEKFPELNYCYYKELRNKNKYYGKLFEAIATATVQEQMQP